MLKELLESKQKLNEQIEALRQAVEQVDKQIDEKIQEPLKQARALAGKDTGTVNIVIDGVKIKQVIAKRVVWDSEKMNGIWNRIREAGDEPENYIAVKTTYGVKEKLYESFPDPVKAIFADARTVCAGAPKVTFE